jgi:hypothetical protein
MTRAEWFIWTIRHGNPRTRSRSLRAALKFELYSLGCRLCGHRIPHWLETKPLPAGRYLLVNGPAPIGIRMLDKLFPDCRPEHLEYLPYTQEASEELKRSGKPFEVVTISHRLGGE